MKTLRKPQNTKKLEEIESECTLSGTKKEQEISSRRYFFKKTVYAAPVLMALGQLVKPTDIQALDSVPGTPEVW